MNAESTTAAPATTDWVQEILNSLERTPLAWEVREPDGHGTVDFCLLIGNAACITVEIRQELYKGISLAWAGKVSFQGENAASEVLIPSRAQSIALVAAFYKWQLGNLRLSQLGPRQESAEGKLPSSPRKEAVKAMKALKHDDEEEWKTHDLIGWAAARTDWQAKWPS